jgi:hypothetical protein
VVVGHGTDDGGLGKAFMREALVVSWRFSAPWITKWTANTSTWGQVKVLNLFTSTGNPF